MPPSGKTRQTYSPRPTAVAPGFEHKTTRVTRFRDGPTDKHVVYSVRPYVQKKVYKQYVNKYKQILAVQKRDILPRLRNPCGTTVVPVGMENMKRQISSPQLDKPASVDILSALG